MSSLSSALSQTVTASSATASATTGANNNNSGGSGPTSSPLLFFVALGFGVVFTNLWIIVGVKYCFRYNQRNRAARALAENGEPIDLAQMQRPHRRRREKKLMSMEEVNERFPLTKYKAWRLSREAQGLPTAGGVDVSVSRAASIKDEAGTINTARDGKSIDAARPTTAISLAQQDHAMAVTDNPPPAQSTSSADKVPEKIVIERTEPRNDSLATVEEEEEEEDEDDPIRTAAPPEMLAALGDTCAICLDNLDEDDIVRGLTCGHAFHAACVDPWLTGRRACCPLCKADYYVPKPRPDAGETQGRRSVHIRLPQSPPPTWLSARAGRFSPRFILAGPRLPVTEGDPAAPAQQEHEQEANEQESRQRSWRSRLPAVSMPRFGRRDQANSSEHGPVEETGVDSADLEAGIRR